MTTVFALLVSAAALAGSADVEATQKQFTDLEAKLMGAVQLRNPQTLDALLSPSFGYSLMIEGREPEVLNRAEWLRLTNDYARLEGFEIRSVAAGDIGDHAIVRVQMVRKGMVGTKDLSGEFVLVDLWEKEGGTWKIRYRVVSRPVPPLKR
jgi:hypothetical protein